MKTKILMLHGALGSKKQFEQTGKILEDKFEIYSIDFEGHGGHESEKEFSIKLFTENVIDFLKKESIESINIFGYSMGGYVGLNTALKQPGKVKKIVTLGTKFNWDIESAEKETRMLNPEKIELKVPQFANKLKAEHYPQNWKTIVEKTASMMMRLAKDEKLEDEDFTQIKHEVIVGIGSLDSMVSFEESEWVSQLCPNGTLKKLEGVEHPIEKINPSELSKYIIESFG